ncbi:UDP-glucosyltransferase 2-like [Pararge aegeria]|uniref:UDP-glucosyltransferase 2-like n=1 Tax=Pararge aegeria TaxID=116150 RepID=UPI0019D2A1CA|nr:UDP-glucosyltransferase 2-like [Pararge aegeria]XP_039760005.1 UDP-glucosyltransferase 2-like [Pararge aegeria]
MAKKIIAFAAIALLVSSSEALRILVFFPMYSKSHSILGHGVANRLLEAGHQVVHVTGFPREKPAENLTEISLEEPGKKMKASMDKDESFKLKNLVGKGNFGDSVFFMYFTYNIHRSIFEADELVQFLRDPLQKFDAAVVEWFFADVIAGIAPVFQCPLIWFASTEAHWQVLKLIDEVPNPAFNVDIFSVSRPPLGFWERVVEIYTMIKKMIIMSVIIKPWEKTLYNEVFTSIAAVKGLTMPSYDEAVYNGSFMLVNSHPSIGTPFRLPQSAKYVAGYHIDSNVSPLSQDLQKVMDGAKYGVIYFSMGSNWKSADMSANMQSSLLNMFAKLKQTVIWKFEEDMDKVPANVRLVKWAPQQAILAHPNLKFFITHGGQLSTTEAIHFGVPVIGIPIAGDQHVNMRSVSNKGFGITVTLAEDMADHIYVAIQKMLGNPTYKIKAKELSFIYHNRNQKPGDELVFWIEHVVATGGAQHLRSPALSLPFYQKMYLDVLLVIMSVLFIGKKLVKKLIRNEKNEKGKKEKTK